MFQEDLTYQCQYCGSMNTIDADLLGENRQTLEEQCTVCDRFNLLTITKDEFHHTFSIEVQSEID